MANETATAAASVAASDKKKDQQQQQQQQQDKREYNPRWKGYTFIILSSLINLSATSNVPESTEDALFNPNNHKERHEDFQPVDKFAGVWEFNVCFGVVTFFFSFAILIVDRFFQDTFHYTKAMDGKFEGYTLSFMVIWWIVGVGYQTQVRGIAYLALNIYFSSWLSLVSSIYTLERWSNSKDILSLKELTGISKTLPSWYVLFLASMVVLGTSINMITLKYETDLSRPDLLIETTQPAAFGVAFGIASTICSFGFILTHYNLIESCSEGGWSELFAAVVMVLMWIVGVAIITQDGGIGATLVGTGYQKIYVPVSKNEDFSTATFYYLQELHVTTSEDASNCTLTINNNVSLPCSDFIPKTAIIERPAVPGSNLYFSVWTCLLSSLAITFRWKAEQALQFAQAQQEKVFQQQTKTTRRRGTDDDDYEDEDGLGVNSNSVDRDDDIDFDDFEDATEAF